MPQSVEAAIELQEIAAVSKQMISPRLSKPLISIVQDTLVGVNRLTRPTEFFTLREYMNLLIHSKRWDGIVPEPAQADPPRWSGKQVVSALLPAVYLSMGNKVWDEANGKDDPNYVIIENGIIKQGVLDGDIFDKALIHILYNDFSPETTVEFIDSLQLVVATYLQNSGFSVGLSDLIADEATLTTISADMNTLKRQIESIQLQVHMGLFDNPSGRTNQDEFENRVFQTLDKVIGAAGKTGLKSLSANNRMVNMVKCGSKGADLNIAQMIALLGQQSIEGKRIAYGFQDRTLPHFKRYDDGAEARGFIESSFVKGLTPAEFFFHAMTGREGLIDTAVKSVTGDTLITIRDKDGVWKTTQIGTWIDELMSRTPELVQHSQPANLELLAVQDFEIWTADSQSVAQIGLITDVTRHDPGTHLYKITTDTTTVTVSASKSLCIYNSAGILYPCEPNKVSVGDCVCVVKNGESTVEQITEIERIEVTDPTMRLYDLTVPSTLNFALANGLVVRDTADSGYMQRQLVKSMEDLRVEHDGSVRDAGGLLVQQAYGDDGTSATKIENQPIGLGKMSDTEIRERFVITDVAADKSQAFITQILADRDMLVQNVWNGRVEKTVQSAVHLSRLISNAVVQMKLVKGQGTVSGAQVLETIASIQQRTRPENQLWGALLRYYLNPKDLVAQGFTENAFEWLAEQIVVKHMKSWVAPGEMAGIIAAQSLGEPTTQMSTPAYVTISARKLNSDEYYVGPIGAFIDGLMTKDANKLIQTIHGPNSHVLDLDLDSWAIMGVGNDETTSWKPISQVSRHPANGGLIQVTTKSGRVTTATLSHSFLKRTPNGIAEIKGSELDVGHRIPVAMRQPESPNALTTYKNFKLTRDFGWLVGMYLADGSDYKNIRTVHNTERIRALASLNKWDAVTINEITTIQSEDLLNVLLELCNKKMCLSAVIFHSNKEFIAGLLSGFFDIYNLCIYARSRSKQLIRDVSRLLPICGVFGTMSELHSEYTLTIINKHAELFKKEIWQAENEALQEIITYEELCLEETIDLIPELGDIIAETGLLLGKSIETKSAIGRRTLQKIIHEFRNAGSTNVDVESNIAILESAANSNIIWDEITNLEITADPHELVYDFTVPGNDSFMVDDSIFVHNTLNTFHLSGVAAKSGMTRGVPRLKELLKVTQNPKATSLTIYLRPDIRKSKEDARRLAQELEFTMLRDLVTVSRIYYDPRDSASLIAEDQEWLSFFASFESSEKSENQSPWIIRLEMDREKMFNKNITMDDISFILRRSPNQINFTYTDHNSTQMVFRIRLITPEGSRSLDDLTIVKQNQNKLLTQTLVRGLPGLKSVSYRMLKDEIFEKNPENDNKYESSDQFVLDTLGTNFLDVLIHPDVDGTRLISNHVHDVLENLGIEAARQILFREIFGLFEQAAPVNYRHVSLLCDAMCNRGRMMSADRYGVNKKKSGPLAKASFEQTELIMLNAAMFGEMDPMTGVSANIMTGQPIRGGTSFCHVLLDEKALKELIQTTTVAGPVIPDLMSAPVMDLDNLLNINDDDISMDGCKKNDLQIMVALPPSNDTIAHIHFTDLPDFDIQYVD